MKAQKFKALWLALVAAGLAGGMGSANSAQAAGFNPNGTSVQMFKWKWNDIAKECTNWLGPQGYGAVQISPPTAASVRGAWWDMYQPVNHQSFTSHMGTRSQLQKMIDTCHAAGVRVYADVVANHVAFGNGKATDGSKFDSATLSYPHFKAEDFHPDCAIAGGDYGTPGNRSNVVNCRLVGLPDLATNTKPVQAKIQKYLETLLGMGIDGFRFDAAKHMQPTDIKAFMTGLPKTSKAGEALWVTQEVIPDGNVNRADYFANGTVNEFKFAYAMKAVFRNDYGQSISQIRSIMGTPGNWGGTWGFVGSENATVFVNNWDTERDGSSLNSSNHTGSPNDAYGTKRYDLANIFMLAWPYGHAQVHSGYNFTFTDEDGPKVSPFDASGKPLINHEWDFIHRWSDISNLVKFRSAMTGTGVDGFTNGSANQIAFSRGAKGFVAINNDNTAWNLSATTLLPGGTYCNVINGGLNAAKTDCVGDKVVVAANGSVGHSLPANGGTSVPAIVLQFDQKLAGGPPTCASVAVTFRIANANTSFGENVYVNGSRAELGNWSPASVNALNIEASGANSAWSKTIQLPPSTAIQYKFAKHGGASDVWESNQSTGSGNREAVSPACGQPAMVLDGGNFQF